MRSCGLADTATRPPDTHTYTHRRLPIQTSSPCCTQLTLAVAVDTYLLSRVHFFIHVMRMWNVISFATATPVPYELLGKYPFAGDMNRPTTARPSMFHCDWVQAVLRRSTLVYVCGGMSSPLCCLHGWLRTYLAMKAIDFIVSRFLLFKHMLHFM